MKIKFRTAQVFPIFVSIVCLIIPSFLSGYLYFKMEYLSQDTTRQIINTILFFILIEILSISSEYGVEIKYDSKLIKKYWTIFWIKIGKWEYIENFTQIEIYRTQNVRELILFPVKFGELNVLKTIVTLSNLNSVLAILITTDDNKAIEIAKKASKYLRLDIYDMLGGETEIYNEYENKNHS
ncbi:MAG: hypothetical protein SFY32_14180 [Bacteroidota bacterium]|nr:hypothetical protein [Bacteroidota bacterium]